MTYTDAKSGDRRCDRARVLIVEEEILIVTECAFILRDAGTPIARPIVAMAPVADWLRVLSLRSHIRRNLKKTTAEEKEAVDLHVSGPARETMECLGDYLR